jgi:uncharacterized phage-associated protein
VNIEFQFDFPRALAAITYIASKNIPDLTIYKLLKLIFLADKYHLIRHGRPITGDRYAALKDGPVPSHIYDVFKRQVVKENPWSDQARKFLEYLTVERSGKRAVFKARAPFNRDELSKSDIAALDKVIESFANFDYDSFWNFTHEMEAYKKGWNSRSFFKMSVPMKFEDFFAEGLFGEDETFLAETKSEVIEDGLLRKALAEPRAI